MAEIILPAEQALRKVNQDMGMGYVPDPLEMLKIGEAIQGILGAVTRQSESLTAVVANQIELKKTLEDQAARTAFLEDRIRDMADSIPPAEREKAQAKLANQIQKKSLDVRAYKGAKQAMTAAALERAKKVDVEWDGEPYTQNVQGVRVPVKRGWNTLPAPVAAVVEMKKRKTEMGKAVDSILREGRRPGKAMPMLSHSEVNHYLNEISKHYNRRPAVDSDTFDAQMERGLSAGVMNE